MTRPSTYHFETTNAVSAVGLAQEIFPPEQQTPQALAALQKTEIAKWWPIIKAAGIKGE
jgi:hypothetical protein